MNMAFDPKVAAGGVAVVAIGGGAGVAIHQGTSGSSEIKVNPIKLAIEEARFTLKTTDAECNKALEKELNENNYKEAVVACVNEDTFKKRAEKLELEVLKTNNIGDTSGDEKTKWDSKWNKNQEAIKTLKTESETLNNLSDAATKIKAFCDDNSKFTDKKTTGDWYKFLKICVKEDEGTTEKKLETALTKDFWHNQVTMGAKMKFAKFADKTDNKGSSCTEENLNKPYESKEYKTLVMDCSKLSNFKARAEELKLTAYPDTGGDTFWNEGWDKVKDRVSTVITFTGDNKNTWDKAKAQVKSYCEGNTNNKTISANTTDREWKDYLKVCTKDKTTGSETVTVEEILAKDFWINQ